MPPTTEPLATVDTYIRAHPPTVQAILQTFRQTVQKAAPAAVEAMSYGVPTFKLHGKNLVSFGAAKSHIGFYPTPSGVALVKDELAGYKSAKGSIQFPLDQPLPLALIRKVVKFRVQEENAKRQA